MPGKKKEINGNRFLTINWWLPFGRDHVGDLMMFLRRDLWEGEKSKNLAILAFPQLPSKKSMYVFVLLIIKLIMSLYK